MKNTKEIKAPTVRNNGILTDALRRASEKAKQEKEKKESAQQKTIKKTSNKN